MIQIKATGWEGGAHRWMPDIRGKSSKAAAFHCTRVWNFEAYFMRMLRQSIQSRVEFWSMKRMP
jgi:hypothetical protein